MQDFQNYLQKQKERSRNASQIDTEDWVEVREGEKTVFLGYDILEAEVEIIRYRKVKQKDKDFYQLVFDKTPFYAELGGQIGDSGYIKNDQETINITTTKTENGLAIHLVDKLPNNISSTFLAVADQRKRNMIEANHSATHQIGRASCRERV